MSDAVTDFLSWIEREWQSYMGHEDFRVEVAKRARALSQAWRALGLTQHATICVFKELLDRALCLMAEAQSCLDPDKDHGDKIAADLWDLKEEIEAALSQEGKEAAPPPAGVSVGVAYKRAARIADYAVERAERDWRDPNAQRVVKEVGREIAEAIRADSALATLSPFAEKGEVE